MEVDVICFSKNRAFQLSELLRSYFLLIDRFDDASTSGSVALRFHVIYTASPKHLASYRLLRDRYPQVEFLQESGFGEEGNGNIPDFKDGHFAAHLRYCLFLPPVMGEQYRRTRFVQFLVDDMLFFRHFPLCHWLHLLDRNQHIWCVHSSLHAGISHSHSANADATPPIFVKHEPPTHSLFLQGTGTHDWDLPINLTGSIYRQTDMQKLWQCMLDQQLPVCHPNRLEVSGNRAFARESSFSSQYPLCASAFVAHCSAITVNRVQEIYRNPVYDTLPTLSSVLTSSSPIAGRELSFPREFRLQNVDDLLELLEKGVIFDLEAYAKSSFSSVHIGIFVLTSSTDATNECF